MDALTCSKCGQETLVPAQYIEWTMSPDDWYCLACRKFETLAPDTHTCRDEYCKC